MPWSTSDRRSRLPKDWHRRRAIAKRNAGGQCQWVTAGQRCTTAGTDCDHVRRDGGDDPSNLQWLCKPHHKTKTSHEAALARQAAQLDPRRTTAKHPGLL